MPLSLSYSDTEILASDHLFADIQFKKICTNGNGGCGKHAVFGNKQNKYNQLFLPQCGEFLYEQTVATATECEKRVDDTKVFSEWIENDIWKDIVIPRAVYSSSDYRKYQHHSKQYVCIQ